MGSRFELDSLVCTSESKDLGGGGGVCLVSVCLEREEKLGSFAYFINMSNYESHLNAKAHLWTFSMNIGNSALTESLIICLNVF